MAQRHGFVSVVFCAGIRNNTLPKGILELGLASSFLIETIPYKIRGFHFCHDSALLRPLLAIIQMAIGSRVRLRLRRHYGKKGPAMMLFMLFSFP